MIPSEKQIVRAQMKALLKQMNPEVRIGSSAAIAEFVREELSEMRAKLVLGFLPMKDEPQWWLGPDPALTFAFPRIVGSDMEFRVVSEATQMRRGARGFDEPHEGEVVSPDDADAIVVPGVAFDRLGQRLGRGGGYYDRLFASATKAVRIGVCFDFQLLESLPVETHDAGVDTTVSEAGVFRFGRNTRDANLQATEEAETMRARSSE